MASFNPEEENEQYGGAFSDPYSQDANGFVGSWRDAVARRDQANYDQQIASNQAEFDNFMNIQAQDRQRIAEMDQRKAIAAAAGLMSMYNSRNGMSDSSLSTSLSESFGRKFFGFQKLSGLSGKDAELNGSVAMVVPQSHDGREVGTTVEGLLTPEMQLQTLQRAKLGDRTLPMQRELWGNLTQKYTPEQLESKGLHNPDGPYVVGSTAIRGGTARRLAGSILGPERRGISAFGANGNGGFTQYRADDATDWDLQQTDTGTRRQPTLQERIASIQASGQRAKADADMRTKLMQAQMQQQGYAARNASNERVGEMNAQSRLQAAQIAANAKAASGSWRDKIGIEVAKVKQNALNAQLKSIDEKLKDPMLMDDEEKRTSLEKERTAILGEIRDVMSTLGGGTSASSPAPTAAHAPSPAPTTGGAVITPTGVINPAQSQAAAPAPTTAQTQSNLPPSGYIKYRDANGKLVAGNGYIVGGKVYDGKGSLIEGAMTDGSYAENADADERMRLAQEQIAKNRAAKAADGGGAQESPAPSPQASPAPSAGGKAETENNPNVTTGWGREYDISKSGQYYDINEPADDEERALAMKQLGIVGSVDVDDADDMTPTFGAPTKKQEEAIQAKVVANRRANIKKMVDKYGGISYEDADAMRERQDAQVAAASKEMKDAEARRVSDFLSALNTNASQGKVLARSKKDADAATARRVKPTLDALAENVRAGKEIARRQAEVVARNKKETDAANARKAKREEERLAKEREREDADVARWRTQRERREGLEREKAERTASAASAKRTKERADFVKKNMNRLLALYSSGDVDAIRRMSMKANRGWTDQDVSEVESMVSEIERLFR